MKRLLAVLLILILVLAVGLVAAFLVVPDRVAQGWTALGLPETTFQQFTGRLPAGLAPVGEPEAPPDIIGASGVIEAEEVAVTAEINGLVVAVLADQGDAVAAGEPLVRLDDSLLQAQLEEAQKAVDSAQANLALAQAPPRESQIAVAEAALGQAQAAELGARQALSDSLRARDSLLELDAQINQAAAQVDLAQRRVEQQQAQRATIVALREGIAGDDTDQGKTQRAIYDKQAAAADQAIASAQREATGVQRVLAQLRSMRANPVTADVQVSTALGQLSLAEAATQVAQAELDLAAAGPRPEAVAVAQAQVQQAQTARDLLLVQDGKYAIASPIAGVVTARSIDPGEAALAGVPLLQVADLGQVTLTVYVPEPRIGLVQVGQPVQVRVDAYPGQVFHGTVRHISPRAEFTPKTIQTPEERVQTVFGVEILLENPDGALKPGMPADAEIDVG